MTDGRGVRLGVLRGLLAVLWAALLVVPVGVQRDGVVTAVSFGEALAELASGRLGVGILSGLVAGGATAAGAAVRWGLVVLVAVAFWLAGRARSTASAAPKARRRTCPYCGSWVGAGMQDCPACGRPLGSARTPGAQRGQSLP